MGAIVALWWYWSIDLRDYLTLTNPPALTNGMASFLIIFAMMGVVRIEAIYARLLRGGEVALLQLGQVHQAVARRGGGEAAMLLPARQVVRDGEEDRFGHRELAPCGGELGLEGVVRGGVSGQDGRETGWGGACDQGAGEGDGGKDPAQLGLSWA
jgi:hypothetical protein